MTAQCGSAIVVSFKNSGGTYQVVAGLRSRSITLNSEIVDVTNADSAGLWREILDECGVRSAQMSGEGVFVDDTGAEAVRDAVFSNKVRDAKIFIPGWGTFEGKWKVSQLQINGDYNGEVKTGFQLDSAGEITFTAA